MTSNSALAYFRTSSATNLDGDSLDRQKDAVAKYAEAHGITIEAEFYDAAVSGTDPIEIRPGFSDMLARIAGNGVRLVLVEDASRLARSVLVSELAILELIRLGVRVVTSRGDDLTDTQDPERVAFRQMAQTFSQLEKTRLALLWQILAEGTIFRIPNSDFA